MVAGKDVPGQQEEHALGQRMPHRMEHGPEDRRTAQPDAQGEDAHMLHAGIGQQALVVSLPHDEDGRREQGDDAEEDQQPAAEVAQPGRQHDLMAAQDAQQSAVEQSAGQQAGHQRRGLTVGVRQPVVQGREAHLGAVAHQQEDEGRLEPGRLHAVEAARPHFPRHIHEDAHLIQPFFHDEAGPVEADGEQQIADQGQRDAHGTDDEIFPRGFQRLLMPVEVDERRAGQSGAFYAHPERAQMPGGGDQRHGRQEEAEAGREAPFRRVGEGVTVLKARAFALEGLITQIAHAVPAGRAEQRAGQRQKEHAHGIRFQQAEKGGGRLPASHGQQGEQAQGKMRDGHQQEQAAPHGARRQQQGQQARAQRKKKENL